MSKSQGIRTVCHITQHIHVSANFMCAKTFNKDHDDDDDDVDNVNDDVEAQLNFMWLCDTNNMIYICPHWKRIR